jgi:hypothetical protein
VDTVVIASSLSTVGPSGSLFTLGAGDDSMTYTGTAPVFASLVVNGGAGSDSFGPESVVAGIPHTLKSIESKS